MTTKRRSGLEIGVLVALGAIVGGTGCARKRPVRPYAAPMPLQLQTVVAVDKDGNQVLAGSFTGRLSVAGKELVSEGGTDIFFVKTAATGGLLFGPVRLGGKGDDSATGVAIDGEGNIVLVGTFQGEAAFGGDKPYKANVRHDGQRGVFAAKLNPAGKLLWFKQVATANLPTQVSVAIRPDQKIVIGASGIGTLSTKKGTATLSGESVMLDLLSPVNGDSQPLPPGGTSLQLFSLPLGCAHSPCARSGGPLDPSCGYYGCVALVCIWDSWCCAGGWDGQCADELVDHCGKQCDCSKVTQESRVPFYPDASPCVAAVYTLGGPDGTGDPFCSEHSWDSWCLWDMNQPAVTAACHPACQ